jgi:hypothetical protein
MSNTQRAVGVTTEGNWADQLIVKYRITCFHLKNSTCKNVSKKCGQNEAILENAQKSGGSIAESEPVEPQHFGGAVNDFCLARRVGTKKHQNLDVKFLKVKFNQ